MQDGATQGGMTRGMGYGMPDMGGGMAGGMGDTVSNNTHVATEEQEGDSNNGNGANDSREAAMLCYAMNYA
jgi:hypothetical protein